MWKLVRTGLNVGIQLRSLEDFDDCSNVCVSKFVIVSFNS